MKGMKFLCTFVFACTVAFLSSCSSDDVENLYSNEPARLYYSQVATTPQLRAALTSPGEFCIITYDLNKKLIFFSDYKGNTTPANFTADIAYRKPISVAKGFVIGTPQLPSVSGNGYEPVCYDLVCPNCLRDNSITRQMVFSGYGKLHCGRCNRVYDLNNSGMVVSGEDGRTPLRYRFIYNQAQNVLLINN